MSARLTRWYRVTGRVQGVGFRWFVREAARALDVGGWVRNETDGAVVVVATGTAAQLTLLEASIRRGPPGAFVRDIEWRALEDRDDDGAAATTDKSGAATEIRADATPFQVVRASPL